jgi:hypothetical protein
MAVRVMRAAVASSICPSRVGSLMHPNPNIDTSSFTRGIFLYSILTSPSKYFTRYYNSAPRSRVKQKRSMMVERSQSAQINKDKLNKKINK